jgi:hypothetical protein
LSRAKDAFDAIGSYSEASVSGGLDVTIQDVGAMRKPGAAVSVLIGLLGIVLCASSAAANTRQQIQFLCATNWPKQPELQRECTERQIGAADELLKRIESASQSSIEFAIAKSCIERAKIRQPSTIDWTQALTCFKNRSSGPPAAAEP